MFPPAHIMRRTPSATRQTTQPGVCARASENICILHIVFPATRAAVVSRTLLELLIFTAVYMVPVIDTVAALNESEPWG